MSSSASASSRYAVLGNGRLGVGYLPGDALIELEGRSRLSVGIEGYVLFGILVREEAR